MDRRANGGKHALAYTSSPTAPQIALNYRPYYDDGEIRSEYGPSSPHEGGAHHLFGDGSVHFLFDSIDATSYVALTTRAGDDLAPEHQ